MPLFFFLSLPEPSSRARNASAIFGASPSFGISPVPQIQFRPAPPKRVPEPKKVRRSNSDVALRKRPYLRRRSGDFCQAQRKRSESESDNRLNGVNCNGTTASESKLSSGSGSDCIDTTADSVCSLPEQSHDSNDFSSRYPLFISVNNGCQASNKTRIVKPVAKSNQGGFKQDNAQDKSCARPRRSASFSTPKKTGPASRSPQTSQDSFRNGSLRREKSDIVRPRRTQSPANNNNSTPSSARSNSSSNLKRENGTIPSPRSQSPAGLQRERSDITKNRASPSVRREKSDIVRPRGKLRTNSPIVTYEDTGSNINRTSSNRSLTSSSLSNSPSKSSIESSRSRSGSSSEMSKIPSLVRSPGSAEKTDSHVSRIPSITKKNGAEERTPPKSKIPSSNKSQIPTTGRKEGALQKDKTGGKISSSATSSHNRPDSAKENKDPTSAPNGHEPAKQVSKIPSFSKSGIPKSRIPSVTRKDSQNEGQVAQNGGEAHSPVTGTQSKIPNASSSPQGSGIPMGVSRIPSFTKSPLASPGTKIPQSKLSTVVGSKATEPDGPPGNSSCTPTTPSTSSDTTPETKVPTAGGSKIPEPKIAAKSPSSSLPIASKTSGIPKSGESTPSSKIPGHAGDKLTRKTSSAEKETVPTGNPTAASSPVESKIPSFPKHAATQKSVGNLPNGHEQVASKPRTGIPTFGGRQPSFDKEPATPPSTPIRENFSSESPLDKYIFSEARKMEQIFRDEPIEVVVPAADLEEDEEFLRQEKEIEELEENSHDSELQMLDSKEAEDLISEVLKSYAPDINTENQLELDDSYVFSVKDDNKNFKEKVNIDDIVLKPASNENESPNETKIVEKPSTKEDVDDGKAKLGIKDLMAGKDVVQNGADVTKEATKNKEKETAILENKKKTPDLKILMPTEKVVERQVDEKTEKEATKNEGPAIDTLGEYAQHARRSRSRQRKIVSPDSEEPGFVSEPEKEVEKEPEKPNETENIKEPPKKDINKDKFGKAPFESEKKPKVEASKTTKSKSKNDKPKFLIESSLGKDFYASRKSNESVESRDSVHDDVVKSSFKPELSALVFENKIVEETYTLKQKESPVEEAVSLEEAEFEDVDLLSEKSFKNERREITRSVDELDEKTVKCMGCGRGGKCSIM